MIIHTLKYIFRILLKFKIKSMRGFLVMSTRIRPNLMQHLRKNLKQNLRGIGLAGFLKKKS